MSSHRSAVKTDILAIDARMLQVMDHCIAGLVRGISTESGWAIAVGVRPSRIAQIRSGRRHFTIHQMGASGRLFNVNMNWLFGFEPNMFRITPQAA